MNTSDLIRIMPLCKAQAAIFAPLLTAAMAEFGINTPARQASFLSQIAQESGQLTRLVENLNYGAPGLLGTFPTHFNAAQAALYARQPERIANRAYADRLGNGNEASGDGWRYRGRGLIQITGRTNYAGIGAKLGCDLVTRPELLEAPALACRSAALFWRTNGLNTLADAGDQRAVTRRVNGGVNGLAERLAFFDVAQGVLA